MYCVGSINYNMGDGYGFFNYSDMSPHYGYYIEPNYAYLWGYGDGHDYKCLCSDGLGSGFGGGYTNIELHPARFVRR